MKLFISSDIEGTTGIVNWEETEAGTKGDYSYFKDQMTREVIAACQGASEAGCDDILVKDAHGWGRSINPRCLPLNARINRDWAGDLMSMASGLDESFDAMAFTGYHDAASSPGNPLSHTYTLSIAKMTINGALASEFMMFAYAAGMLKVPVVFLSGDAGVCARARALVPGIETVETNVGVGQGSTSIHPDLAVQKIKEGMKKALSKDLSSCLVKMPESFDIRITYTTHMKAYSRHFYTGAWLEDDVTLGYKTDSYLEFLRFFHFVK